MHNSAYERRTRAHKYNIYLPLYTSFLFLINISSLELNCIASDHYLLDMEIKKESVLNEYIYNNFSRVESMRELKLLLNGIYRIINQDTPRAMIGADDFYILSVNIHRYADRYYQKFTIKKKSGKDRVIDAPCNKLKRIQQCLNAIFQVLYKPNDVAIGFIPNRSIADGACQHVGKKYVYSIDLKDFFDYITMPRLKAALEREPFLLTGAKMNLNYIISYLCTCPKEVTRRNAAGEDYKIRKDVLPQGAPTSPILTNIICDQMDGQLTRLAKRFSAHYTRYADDITFSCNRNIFYKDSKFVKELYRIVEDEQHFCINPEKTRLQTCCERQTVTGLVVNKRVNLPKQYVRQLRQWLYFWERYGYYDAQFIFLPRYLGSKGHSQRFSAELRYVLEGKLDYMKMVVGEDNPTYQKLKQRYDKLLLKTSLTKDYYKVRALKNEAKEISASK